MHSLTILGPPAFLASPFFGVLVCLALLLISTAGCSKEEAAEVPAEQPNIVFVLTDDLDYASAQRMPEVRSRLIEEGASFEAAFVSYPLCCPSRATILTGLYAHNHRIVSNELPSGGFQKFLAEGHEENTIATRLQQSGYKTAFFGKYLNQYPGEEDPTHVPPGWDEWYGKLDEQKLYDYRINENGQVVSYGSETEDFFTDVLSGQVIDFARRAAADSQPFFMYVASTAPHLPATPGERHKDAFAGEEAPRSLSFDEENVSDKPPWIRNMRRIPKRQVSRIDERYRERLSSMLAVDEMVASLVQKLEAAGELDDTFIFFTSDNGWQQGEHRIKKEKLYPYEESVHTPLFVRGPGVPARSKIYKLVLNTDFAPTFADLVGASFPVDGRSLAPLLLGKDPPWRSAVLLEGAGHVPPTYAAIRTESHKYVEYVTGDRELYDLRADPYELDNIYETADSSLIESMKARLDDLRRCAGDGCQEAEDSP